MSGAPPGDPGGEPPLPCTKWQLPHFPSGLALDQAYRQPSPWSPLDTLKNHG
ncbi:hypothetical protein PERCYII40_0980 [Pseudomonas aeruginosa]|nr:hypothetical protein PERCYII40_0980 [Pseudomonas aeruginosa]